MDFDDTPEMQRKQSIILRRRFEEVMNEDDHISEQQKFMQRFREREPATFQNFSRYQTWDLD